MGVIRLEGLEFFAHHGYHHEEQKLGNRYTVDVLLTLDVSKAATNDDLEGTINYERVYRIVSKIMNEKAKLLEHLAHKINETILDEHIQLSSVECTVAKHNPPLKGICRVASVTLTGSR